MSDDLFAGLDERFQPKARLGIMTLLASMGKADFSRLKTDLGLTDGNLGAHVRVLEEAGYVLVEKGFVGRRPRTWCRLSSQGRLAFLNHLRMLESLIERARAGDDNE